ncbi:MAG: hypothetical protein FWE82_02960 [Defluviitaleaceae bacterium]|nr:hypothetical protein [Defluviitaleaceae bacterium]
MLKNHMWGITPAHSDPNFALMKDMGVKWVRTGYPFPFENENGTVSERFKKADAVIDRYIAEGFGILCSFTGPGSVRYSAETGKTEYCRAVPEYLGDPSEDRYSRLLFEAAEFLGEHTKKKITWWQIANEPDIDIFYGPLSEKENINYLLNATRGILKTNPEAKCGINLGYINNYARMLMREIYAVADSPFEYLGIDGYQGSWQMGGPQSWNAYIDETAKLSSKPIIINEWGFSSLQWGEKYTDPERKKHYNQDVCRHKHWYATWGRGHTPDEQARYISECLPIFIGHPCVIGNFFFRWSDTETCWQCGEADCPAECAWGCVDCNQKPKPAYYALQEGIKKFS